MQRGKQPYQSLGDRLKRIRQDAKESLAETSGAVEIDLDSYDRFEKGEIRPSEDILLLLISHFSLKDDDADSLWSLGDYDKKKGAIVEEPNLVQQAVVLLPMDARIVYTDMVNVTANNFGIIMNFLQQGVGQGAQPMAVARVGMSIDHAKSVLSVLERSIAQATGQIQPKQLPAPNSAAQDDTTA